WILPDVPRDLLVCLFVSRIADGKDNGLIDPDLFGLAQEPFRVVVGGPRGTGRVCLTIVLSLAGMTVRIDHATRRSGFFRLLDCSAFRQGEGSAEYQASLDKSTPVHGNTLPLTCA